LGSWQLAVPFWQWQLAGGSGSGSAIGSGFGSGFGSWQCHLAVGSWQLAVGSAILAVVHKKMKQFPCKYCGESFNSQRTQYRHQAKCANRTNGNENEEDDEIETEVSEVVFNQSSDPPFGFNAQQPEIPQQVSKFAVPMNNIQEKITTTKMLIHHPPKEQFKATMETLANILFNSVDALVEKGYDDGVIESVISSDEQFTNNLIRLDRYYSANCETKKQELKKFNDQVELMIGNSIKDEDLDEIFNLISDEKITLAEKQYQMKLCKLKAKMWEKEILQIGVDRTVLVTDRIKSVIRKILEDDDGLNFNTMVIDYLNVKKKQNNIRKIQRRLWLKRHKIELIGAFVFFISAIIGSFLIYRNWTIIYVGFALVISFLAVIVYYVYI
jgi:hypothetical protein